MENKDSLEEYMKRIEEAKRKTARWNRVALIGAGLSAGFMIMGIILRIIMAMRGIG